MASSIAKGRLADAGISFLMRGRAGLSPPMNFCGPTLPAGGPDYFQMPLVYHDSLRAHCSAGGTSWGRRQRNARLLDGQLQLFRDGKIEDAQVGRAHRSGASRRRPHLSASEKRGQPVSADAEGHISFPEPFHAPAPATMWRSTIRNCGKRKTGRRGTLVLAVPEGDCRPESEGEGRAEEVTVRCGTHIS